MLPIWREPAAQLCYRVAVVSDRELWACAAHVLRQYGASADAHIAERIRALAETGDMAGVATWQAIATRLDRLRDGTGDGHRRH